MISKVLSCNCVWRLERWTLVVAIKLVRRFDDVTVSSQGPKCKGKVCGVAIGAKVSTTNGEYHDTYALVVTPGVPVDMPSYVIIF